MGRYKTGYAPPTWQQPRYGDVIGGDVGTETGGMPGGMGMTEQGRYWPGYGVPGGQGAPRYWPMPQPRQQGRWYQPYLYRGLTRIGPQPQWGRRGWPPQPQPQPQPQPEPQPQPQPQPQPIQPKPILYMRGSGQAWGNPLTGQWYTPGQKGDKPIDYSQYSKVITTQNPWEYQDFRKQAAQQGWRPEETSGGY